MNNLLPAIEHIEITDISPERLACLMWREIMMACDADAIAVLGGLT
jgi:hypothetical protein